MTETTEPIPETQYAVQLVAPSELKLNKSKEVFEPGPHQVLGKIEAVGLCFSDLKLLKQFSDHPRKGEIVSGLSAEVLAEIPSYVPGDKPTVPGHETVCRIVAVGEKVSRHRLGERCLVQTDYRALKTAESNGAFGYNFEGALEEYVLMDERVIIDPQTDKRYLIEVDDELSASAVCLIEPWACVEDSYVTVERRTAKPGGRMLIVAESGAAVTGIAETFGDRPPASITAVCGDDAQRDAIAAAGSPSYVDDPDELADESFDDILYFGAERATLETLNDKLAAGGVVCIVTGGKTIGEPVSISVGRLHYGMTRWVGTDTDSPADAYGVIPETGEIRPGDRIAVIGAGGPMGQMHVIRALCAGVKDLSIVASDFDTERLESLMKKAAPLADANGVELTTHNPKTDGDAGAFDYIALMAPVPQLVADAVAGSRPGCLINVFAGIPASVRHEIDLDRVIANRCFLFGTSGSVIRDMMIVLEKVRGGQLDTNSSVDAICGMAGAVEGIHAVENRTLAGKIIVYPMLHDVGLIPLTELGEQFPTVAGKLDGGVWTKDAETELLRVASGR